MLGTREGVEFSCTSLWGERGGGCWAPGREWSSPVRRCGGNGGDAGHQGGSGVLLYVTVGGTGGGMLGTREGVEFSCKSLWGEGCVCVVVVGGSSWFWEGSKITNLNI